MLSLLALLLPASIAPVLAHCVSVSDSDSSLSSAALIRLGLGGCSPVFEKYCSKESGLFTDDDVDMARLIALDLSERDLTHHVSAAVYISARVRKSKSTF